MRIFPLLLFLEYVFHPVKDDDGVGGVGVRRFENML